MIMLRMVMGLFLMASATTGLGLQIMFGLIGLGFFLWSFYELAMSGELDV